MDEAPAALTRRSLLQKTALTAASATAAGGLIGQAWAAPARAAKSVRPLPSASAVRADIQRMVDLGPRFTGTRGHGRFVDWLEEELLKAGCVMLPREHVPVDMWEAHGFGLELLAGTGKGRVKVASYYPRSKETGPGGVTGPLVDAAAPAASTHGAILVVDLHEPAPLTAGAFLPLTTYTYWPGHTSADFAASDYKRPWIAPGVSGAPTAQYQAQGAVGVIYILDAPYEAIRDIYAPFENGFEDLPALFVDRDTGAKLRTLALSAPEAKLTLTATRKKTTAPALLGYLPGAAGGDEALFVDTHTDGEGFVEENGGIGLVGLARHFGSLPRSKRLKRALVFSLWPGHMAPNMPQLQGVLDAHPKIVRSSVAGITVEHLGCTEWIDTPGPGYHATGEAELLGVWTTQGKVFDICKEETAAHDIQRAALLRPPVQFGVGGALQTAGVPQVGFLAGPYYLLSNAPGGDMEKLDAALASRQVAWTASMLRRFDTAAAADLAAGDPTLGKKTAGPRATFPPRPALRLRLAVNPLSAKGLLHSGRLGGKLTLNRTGRVRLTAVLRRGRRTVTVGARTVAVKHSGATRFALPLTARGRRALRRDDDGTVIVTARFTDVDGTHAKRTARRALRS
ncbi:MAG: hypothetical protein QOK31_1708 [Solirubrobacteraceae bacterium]|nr:hypothetical protein [Solirubrobacteraceae bacterium]